MSVQLREVEPADLPIIFEHQRDPEAQAMAAVAGREREAFDAHWAEMLEDPTVVVRVILLDGEVAGAISIFEQQDQHLVGYWIARDHWGKGVASAALSQMLVLVTERPLHATVATHNHGSLRVLERCGFTRVRARRDDDGVPLWVLRLD